MRVDPAHSLGAPNPFFRRNEIEVLRATVLLLLVALHFVHFCPSHGLLMSLMSRSSMRHFVVGHLVLAHLVLAPSCPDPSCPDPSCPDPSCPGPSCPGPSCHPSFYPAAPQCRSATKRWQGQAQWPYKPTRWSQRWPHVIFFSAFLVSP